MNPVVVGESIEILKLTCHWLSSPSGRNRIDDGASDRLAGGVEPVPCKAEILDTLANPFLKPLLVGNEPHLWGLDLCTDPAPVARGWRSGARAVCTRSFFRPSRFKKRIPPPTSD